MATQILHLPDETPVNAVDALSLSDGSNYVLSVDGQRSVRLFEGGSEAPTARHGHEIQPGQHWSFQAGADPIWLWTHKDGTTVVVSGS